MIDRQYYRLDMGRYYLDMTANFVGFAAGFAICVSTTGAVSLLAGLAAAFGLQRCAYIGHDVVHRFRDPKMKRLGLYWDLTVGTVGLLPVARFFKPHIIHHSPTHFRTTDDPQYILLRQDWRLAAITLVVAPFAMPFFCAAMTLGAAVGGVRLEEAWERWVEKGGRTTGSVPSPAHYREVVARSRIMVGVWAIYLALAPATLPTLYAILVAMWFLIVLRIPLEHGLQTVMPADETRDQAIDSFTIESRFADILQPLGMKYHTAHHLYPGVPYYNLARLHEELKASDPTYRASVVSLWQAARGPVRTGGASVPT